MIPTIILWIAIAWPPNGPIVAIAKTPSGPIVGTFDNSHDCKVAVGYARMQGYRVTVFRRRDLNDRYVEGQC